MNEATRIKGKRIRNRIINELKKSPLTFTQLKTNLQLYPKTLADHLKSLRDEKFVERKFDGKDIKYVITQQPQLVLQMKKDFKIELSDLFIRYDSCLNNETHNFLVKALQAVQKNIDNPIDDFGISEKTAKIITLHIRPPPPPKVEKPKRQKKRGRPKDKIRRVESHED